MVPHPGQEVRACMLCGVVVVCLCWLVVDVCGVVPVICV